MPKKLSWAHWRHPKGCLAFYVNSDIYWCYNVRH